jgi:ABC-type transporter Mla subunit MlaD
LLDAFQRAENISRGKGITMTRNFFFAAISALVIIGCIGTSHNFKIRFNDIAGLKQNDRVFFDKTPIGKVVDIEYTDKGSYLVTVAVEDQFSSLPKDSSTFYIDTNPEAEGQKAIQIIQIEDGGNTLKQNAVVEGQSKYAAIYGQIANKLRKNVHALESELNEFFRELQNLSESEKIKQIERQLDKILAELENFSLEMKHKLETEILPRIKEQLKDLKRRLEESGKEEKLKRIEQKIETISAKLKV